MSMLSNLSVTDDIELSKDSVGGTPIQSGVYAALVKAVYLSESAGGALAANVHLDIEGREIRQQLWITSGTAKGKLNYYVKDGRKVLLPGFDLFRSLSLMTAGVEPDKLDPQNGVMNVWSRDQGKEVPQEVPLVREMSGTKIQVGLIRKIVDKVTLNESTNSYEPTGETREIVEVDKFFHAETGQTLVEALGNAEGSFINTWRDKYEGEVIDKSTGGDTVDTRPQTSAFSPANVATTAPKQSLFG